MRNLLLVLVWRPLFVKNHQPQQCLLDVFKQTLMIPRGKDSPKPLLDGPALGQGKSLLILPQTVTVKTWVGLAACPAVSCTGRAA